MITGPPPTFHGLRDILKLRTGAPWRDLPERYGPWKTCHERLRVWTADSTWDRILDHVIVKDDSVGAVEWTFSIDSSSVRAHQHAAGARKKGAAPPGGSKTSPSAGKPSADPAEG
jgi:transposase